MQIGIFEFDLTSIFLFFEQGPLEIIIELFALGGWLVFFYFLLLAGLTFLADYKSDEASKDWQWVMLAIDIPAMNVQTPKAVEQLFSHLAGALSSPGIGDVYRKGHKQRSFSFEIISIEGYIQFLIRTEAELRDLVEAALYAQYPDAEVVEVEDYVHVGPEHFPDATYDMWGTDFGLEQDDAYPIRTYQEFEHNISKDTVLKDPMGTFLESFTRIGSGEQIWFQIIIEPISNSWKEKAMHKVDEIIGAPAHHSNPFGFLTDNMLTKEIGKSFGELGSQLLGRAPSEHEAPVEHSDKPEKLQYLTPGQSKILEGIEKKISKIGLKTKIRVVYIARKEVFKKSRVESAIIGAINQFNIPTSNSIVPGHAPHNDHHKSEFLQAYRKRKAGAGGKKFVLNIEELATIWHFPMSHVKTPLIQKAKYKVAEPPGTLPVESDFMAPEESHQAAKPRGKTYTTDSGDIGYLDDDLELG